MRRAQPRQRLDRHHRDGGGSALILEMYPRDLICDIRTAGNGGKLNGDVVPDARRRKPERRVACDLERHE